MREHEMYDTIRDRRPYVCTCERCAQNPSFYSTEKLWIDIGRRKVVQILRAKKESCFAWLSSLSPIILIMKEHQRSLRGNPFCICSFFASSHTWPKARGKGLGQAQRSVDL